MPPSVEVSPSNQNKDVNNSANDVMSALSLAMANALLEQSQGVENDGLGSSVDVPTTSRASSNDGLSIWGSSSSSYTDRVVSFMSPTNTRNNNPFLKESSPASTYRSSQFNFSKFSESVESYGFQASPPNDSFSSDSSRHYDKFQHGTVPSMMAHNWNNEELFKEQMLFDQRQQPSPQYTYNSPQFDEYNLNGRVHYDMNEYERRRQQNTLSNQVFVMALPVGQEQMFQMVPMVPPQPPLIVPYHDDKWHNPSHILSPKRKELKDYKIIDNLESSESIASLYHSSQRPHLSVLLGHVRRLSRDQVGCRLLQQSLDEDGPHAATAILREGLPFLGETMTDPFGNYLFQKILEKVSPAERLELIRTVSPRLVNAALNLHGTRSVQKVVELSVTDTSNGIYPAAEVVTHALSSSAARLCIDSHGNHVIQRILQKFPPQYSKFIFDAVAHSVGDVARHRHGCCVIQRCLDSPPTPARSNLVKRIVKKALDLMQDAYGNYVVQYVLDVCNDEEASAVCESVVGRVAVLAIQKFSSNVMEKCLERSSDWVQELYLRELSAPDKVRELMADPFGNYVVQRALAVATHSQAIRLVEAMRPHLQGMRNTAGGRRIIAKICRRFPDFDLNITPSPQRFRHSNDVVTDYETSSTSSNAGVYVHNGGSAM